MAALIVLAVLVLFVLVLLARTVRVIPQARAGVVERLGRYSRTLTPGLALVIPFVDQGIPVEYELVRKDGTVYTVLSLWQRCTYRFFDPAPMCHR